MTIRSARLTLVASLLALGACTAETGAPDLSRGSADSPMTMVVDQTVNGVPSQGGTQAMIGASAQQLNPAYLGPRPNYGGVARPIEAQGGQRF